MRPMVSLPGVCLARPPTVENEMSDPWELLTQHARGLLRLMVGVVVGAHLVYWFYAPYNGDEGMYLYVSRLALEGKLLYRDTPFHQFPLLPYFYGAVLEPLGGGLYLGRLLSVVLSVSAFLLLLPVARVVAGEGGAVCYALLFGLNFWAFSNMVRVKHYALTTLFLSLGVYVLLAYNGRKSVKIVGALLAFGLAASSRISTLPVLVLAYVYLLRRERENRRAVWMTHAMVACSLVLIFSYAFLVPFSSFFSWTFRVNLSSYKRRGLYRFFTRQLQVFRGLVIFRIPSMAILLLFSLRRVLGQWQLRIRSAWASPSPTIFLAAVSLTLFVVHFFVGQVAEDYHVNYLPLVAILAARAFHDLAREARQRHRVSGFSRLSLVLALLTVVTGVRYGFLKKDAFQIPSTLSPFYAEAAVMARRTSPQGAEVLTFDTIVPYLAHREVTHGLEYSHWTYRPGVSDAEARGRHLLNAARARSLILSHRAQAVQEYFLGRFLRESDPDGAVVAAVREYYVKDRGYYYLAASGR